MVASPTRHLRIVEYGFASSAAVGLAMRVVLAPWTILDGGIIAVPVELLV